MIENVEAVPIDGAMRVRVESTSTCTAALPNSTTMSTTAIVVESATTRGWASAGAVAFGAFIIVMTETLPVGLLLQIADGLHVRSPWP